MLFQLTGFLRWLLLLGHAFAHLSHPGASQQSVQCFSIHTHRENARWILLCSNTAEIAASFLLVEVRRVSSAADNALEVRRSRTVARIALQRQSFPV